jgi:hypothetical protein
MSLAKYVDLLHSRAIFFPKASLFPDETEGKWIAHAFLWGQKQHWQRTKVHADTLQALLERTEGSPDRILQEAALLYAPMSELDKKSVLGDVLAGLLRVYLHKRVEYLKGLVESWTKYHDSYNSTVQEWVSQVAVHRESTYISCWSRASSMSAAMWNLYGGTEAVAIRSSVAKLRTLLQSNSAWLQKHSFDGEVIEVYYADGLKEPDENLQADLLERVSVGTHASVGPFSIKPSLYEYEKELRAVLYPKRGLFEPLINPHPGLRGVALPIEGAQGECERPITGFIESVHVHPTLDSESMMVRVVQPINVRFGFPEIPIVADRIEAIGPNLLLKPSAKRGG